MEGNIIQFYPYFITLAQQLLGGKLDRRKENGERENKQFFIFLLVGSK
jgi:hypothetical protein